MTELAPLEERVFLRVDATGDCWQWTGYFRAGGYGEFQDGDRRWRAHRLVWTLLVGPIPAGLQLDHLCRNRGCVNPDHLEAVPQRTNILRGYSPLAMHARATSCAQGHPFSGRNLIHDRGARRCRTCINRKKRARRARDAAGRRELRAVAA